MLHAETTWIKAAIAAMGGIAAYLWGPWDALIIALLVCAAIDYLTGVLKALCKKELSSEIGFRGIGKKIFMFAIVALANIIDGCVPATNGAIRSAAMLFYIANEGLSIVENAGEMGLPVPKILKDAIKSLKKTSGETEEDTDNNAEG